MQIQPPENMDENILKILIDRFGGEENIPNAYRILAENPDILLKFMAFRDEIMKDSSVGRTLKEMIAVKVSLVNQCNACYLGHVKKLRKIFGDSAEKVLAGESSGMIGEREKAALRFAEEAARNKGKIDGDTVKELKEHFNRNEVLEIFLVVSLYMFLNTFNNLLEF